MSTETEANTPETGLAGPGKDAPSDDIATEAFDRVEAPDDDEDPADPPEKADGEGDADDPDKPEAKSEDGDHVEVERNGQKYKVPKALEGELLMQADYTRKTTELSEARRQFEEAQTTWESQREQSRAALPEEHARVAVLGHSLADVDKQLEQFKAIDWDAWRTQVSSLAEDDPNRLKYARYRDAYMGARDSRIDLVDRIGEAKTDLSTKEAERLTKQQETASADLAKRRQETGRVLAAEVPGWNAEKAGAVIAFANDHLGVKPEEMGEATDPRLWKMTHEIMSSRAEIASLKKALKQQQMADNHGKAQTTTPAATPKGNGGATRDPSTPRGDGLSTEQWMERRQKQVGGKR
jgi:hypothetical protein